MADPAELAARFRRFSETSSSPLYATLAAAAAGRSELLDLLRVAPEQQQIPVLLFAAVHDLLLGEPDAPLAAWYPNLAPEPRRDDPSLAFVRLCRERAAELRATIASRVTQTNEIGRCAFLLPALHRVAAETGPLAVLDVGTSAGLNLRLDRYDYRYEPGGELRTGSPVLVEAGTRGPVPVPGAHPPILDRLGLDRAPIDVTDEREARWLEACVWPDQVDRFERLAAAVAIARADPPPIVAGDAVDDLVGAIDRLGSDGHPVVMNSWVLAYLTRERRDRYVALLELVGAGRDLTWLFAESPATTPGLPFTAGVSGSELTELIAVRWRDRRRHVHHLATVHPHGRWLHWADDRRAPRHARSFGTIAPGGDGRPGPS